ncbi:hypothetical protein GGD52_003716 [Agrobacterium tumefaciens]|nr:hypothetical protein [Agrobacterium radiobacter]MBB5589095.1 hypothetical protein [Agrobacterium radiobacter]
MQTLPYAILEVPSTLGLVTRGVECLSDELLGLGCASEARVVTTGFPHERFATTSRSRNAVTITRPVAVSIDHE